MAKKSELPRAVIELSLKENKDADPTILKGEAIISALDRGDNYCVTICGAFSGSTLTQGLLAIIRAVEKQNPFSVKMAIAEYQGKLSANPFEALLNMFGANEEAEVAE